MGEMNMLWGFFFQCLLVCFLKTCHIWRHYNRSCLTATVLLGLSRQVCNHRACCAWMQWLKALFVSDKNVWIVVLSLLLETICKQSLFCSEENSSLNTRLECYYFRWGKRSALWQCRCHIFILVLASKVVCGFKQGKMCTISVLTHGELQVPLGLGERVEIR